MMMVIVIVMEMVVVVLLAGCRKRPNNLSDPTICMMTFSFRWSPDE